MGYRFSLVLSREINDDESSLLLEANCSVPVFGTDSLPTNAEVTVAKLDFDDTVSPTLAEAIESALEAVKKVPDLTVPGLTVPAQPAGPVTDDQKVVAGEIIEDDEVTEVTGVQPVAEQQPAADDQPATDDQPAAEETSTKKPSTRKPSTRKPSTRKPAAKKAAAANGHATENGAGSADGATDLVEATASTD